MRKRKDPAQFRQPSSPPLPLVVAERIKRRFVGICVSDPPETFLSRICRQIRHGAMPDWPNMLKLADGLERILEGESANRVFGLVERRGRKRDPAYRLRDQYITAEVAELRVYWRRLDLAVWKVSQRYRKSKSAIHKIYQANRTPEMKLSPAELREKHVVAQIEDDFLNWGELGDERDWLVSHLADRYQKSELEIRKIYEASRASVPNTKNSDENSN